MYLFKITAIDWERIKLSIDSKCRSALRRKRKALGMQQPASQGASSYLVVCTSDSQMSTGNCNVASVGGVAGSQLTSGNIQCLDGTKETKRICTEREETPQRNQEANGVQQQNKNDVTMNAQPSQEGGMRDLS